MSEHSPFDPAQAAMGIAHLLIMALEKEGIPKAEAMKKIWMVDSRGLIVKVPPVWGPGAFLTPSVIGSGQEEVSKAQSAQTE